MRAHVTTLLIFKYETMDQLAKNINLRQRDDKTLRSEYSDVIIMATPIGNRLRQRREAKNMTQQQLAAKVGMRQSAISAIEREIATSAGASNLLKICAVLDTNPQWMLTGKGDPDLDSFLPSDEDISNIKESLSEDDRRSWIAVGLAMIRAAK